MFSLAAVHSVGVLHFPSMFGLVEEYGTLICPFCERQKIVGIDPNGKLADKTSARMRAGKAHLKCLHQFSIALASNEVPQFAV
jgi:hypothetical protein